MTISSPPTLSVIPDLAEISNTSVESSHKNVVQSLDKQKIREFLMKHCPGLITEDVMRNEAFIECLSCSVDNITSYKKQKEIYQDRAKRQKPTTELSKKMKSVDEKLNDLFARMEKASQIKVSLDLGTHNLSIAAAQKNVSLTSIATFAAEISSFIRMENLIYKVNKRISQQKKVENRKISNIVSNDLAVQCYNTDLTWAEGYNRLENIQMIRGISKSKLAQLANVIEEKTFLDEEIVPETYRNCLLLNFPVMYAVKLGAAVFINIRDLIMQPDAFVTMEKEKAVEQTNVTQTEKKKKESVFGPHAKRGRKSLWQEFPSLVPILTNFIKQHSFMAHGKRRETTGTGATITIFY